MLFKNSELILISGASSGIGKATALLCNKEGARIIALGRDIEKLEKLQKEAEFPKNIYLEARDLSIDLESLTTFVTELKNKYGKFSGFAHCAGHTLLKPFKMFSLEDSKKMFDVHYNAGMLLAQGICDRRNCEKSASIVFISSQATKSVSSGFSLYAGAKGAIEASMRALSQELARQNIRANAVSPDHVRTKMAEEHFQKSLGTSGIDEANEHYPLGIIEAEDVANTILFLLSENSSKITGQIFSITGGKL